MTDVANWLVSFIFTKTNPDPDCYQRSDPDRVQNRPEFPKLLSKYTFKKYCPPRVFLLFKTENLTHVIIKKYCIDRFATPPPT